MYYKFTSFITGYGLKRGGKAKAQNIDRDFRTSCDYLDPGLPGAVPDTVPENASTVPRLAPLTITKTRVVDKHGDREDDTLA